MTFSLVVINYHTYQLTKNCLDSFFRHCPGSSWEMILVDNDFNETELKKIEAEFSGRIKIIANQENLGFGRANNQGAKIARGEWLFFVNSDTIVETDILAILEDFSHKYPDSDIIAPKLLDARKLPQAEAFGKMPKLSQIIKKNITATNQIAADIDWVSGAALLIKRELFEKIGGWDEKFFMYLEDTDLCLRVKKNGGKIRICETAPIVHLGGQSFVDNKIKRKYYFQSQNYFFRKHYGVCMTLLMRFIRWPYKLWVLR